MLPIISLSIITGYVIAVCLKEKGIPYSISATYYSLKHPYWFALGMVSAAMLLMPAILDISKSGTEVFAFMACVGLILVGFNPDYKGDKMINTLHMTGAIITLVASQVWVLLNDWQVLPFVWIPYGIYTTWYMLGKKVNFEETRAMFWIEISGLIATFITIFI